MRKTICMFAMFGLATACGELDSPKNPERVGADVTAADDAPTADEIEAVEALPEQGPTDQGVKAERPRIEPESGALLECASSFIDHRGAYYSVRVYESDPGTRVETWRVQLPFERQDTGRSEVLVSEREVDVQLVDGFFGFELADGFLTAQETEHRGLFRGAISGETEFESRIDLTCWSADLEFPARYHPATGGCVGALGEPARNRMPFAYVRHTGFGQCATFKGSLNEGAFGYTVFADLDLRGADLSGASLHFADLSSAQLQGADLTTFDYGYASVGGRIDEFTALPEFGTCESDDGQLACFR